MTLHKYRGKSVEKANKGEWVYGYLLSHNLIGEVRGTKVGATMSLSYTFVDPKTVGQWARLTDREDQEIYDGDICTLDDRQTKLFVAWHRDRWSLCITSASSNPVEVFPLGSPSMDRVKVLSNVHDNPNILLATNE